MKEKRKWRPELKSNELTLYFNLCFLLKYCFQLFIFEKLVGTSCYEIFILLGKLFEFVYLKTI